MQESSVLEDSPRCFGDDSSPSLVAHSAENPPAVRETWVWSLGREYPLEEGMATHSSVLAWRILMHREAWQAIQSTRSQRVGHG